MKWQEHWQKAMAFLLIDGLGTFKASIGVREDKEMDTINGEESKHNAATSQQV